MKIGLVFFFFFVLSCRVHRPSCGVASRLLCLSALFGCVPRVGCVEVWYCRGSSLWVGEKGAQYVSVFVVLALLSQRGGSSRLIYVASNVEGFRFFIPTSTILRPAATRA